MSIKVGSDEFCSNCMDWREYNEEGKCKICGKQIIKKFKKEKNKSYAEYEIEIYNLEETEKE